LQRDRQGSPEEVAAIISKQMPESKKITLADYIIFNDGKQLLIPQVIQLHHELLLRAKKQ
jgi:dephospho-CoA kinase